MNPWERYAQPDSGGPWDRYAGGAAPAPAPNAAAIATQDKQSTARDLPWWQAALLGAGHVGDAGWAGMKQLGIGLTGAAANALPESGMKSALEDYVTRQAGAVDRTQRENTQQYAPLAQERPWMTGLGEALPTLAIPGGAAVRGAKGLEMLAASGAQGAIPGLVEYGTAGERGTRGAVGAAGGLGGGLFGMGVSRAIQPFRAPAENATRAAALQAADELGVKLTPAEITGSRPLKWAQAAVDDLPFAAGFGASRRQGNAQALTGAAVRSIGETGNELTPAVLASARDNIGAKFDQALSGLSIRLDPQFQADMMGITGSKVMKELRNDSVESLIAPFKNLPPGQVKVSGEWFQQNRSALDSAIREAYASGQTGKAEALQGFEDALHDAAMRAMPKDGRAAYETARQQWANLRMLETGNVVNRDASSPLAGSVMPKQLDSAMAARYKDAYKEGKLTGDLPKVAQAGMLLREPPQSGTFPRMAYSGGIGGGGVGMAAGLVDPLTFGAAAASPVVAQLAMNNPLARRYARNGLFAVSPQMQQLLIRGGAYPATGAALSSSY